MSLALWFSVTAVVPNLRAEFGFTDTDVSILTSSVALGFVVGTFISAILGLADRIAPQRLFMLSSAVAAAANLMIVFLEPTSAGVVVMRIITGICMAGIYPVGMKIAATWADGDTGLLVGLLVGALTLGSSVPHLFNSLTFNSFATLNWQTPLLLASFLALISAIVINAVHLGPNHGKAPPFKPKAALNAWRHKPLRLANFGYFGHMWELYAMWAWIGVFLLASFSIQFPDNPQHAKFLASLVAWAVIAMGAVGSLVAGVLADKYGRTTITMASLMTSGGCALFAGALFGGPPWALIVLCLLWGLAVVADSAQFSSCIIELSDRDWIGTMLTVQTCIGFSITIGTIHMLPWLVDWVSWRYAMASLALGPLFGCIAMWQLRQLPQARQLANGAR
jgi:MFS family permease